MNNNKLNSTGSLSTKNCPFKYMVFLFSIALFSSVSAVYAETDITVSASYDTYFSNKSKKAKRKNYDDKPTLFVKRGRETITHGYIKFNVADLRDKETLGIKLNVFVSSLGKSGRRLLLEKMDPSTLGPRNNWKNRPVRATYVGAITVNNTGRYLFDISRIVNRHLLTSSSNDIVFRLRVDGKSKKNWLRINSLEAGNSAYQRDGSTATSLEVDLLDRDGDGVPDTRDAFPDDPSETKDKDGDGVGNNSDNCRAVSNPDQANQDGDSAGDACDAFPADSTETVDTDGDGVGDNSDAFPTDPIETTDTDGDGTGDNRDNCPVVSNPDQANQDGDSAGDACDAFLADSTETTDTDGDGVGDNSDDFPEDPNETTDTDGDGVSDDTDNCPSQANNKQSDLNSNGIGDLCDPDIDGDGWLNDLDNCPLSFNMDQADSDGDGIGDACYADGCDISPDGVGVQCNGEGDLALTQSVDAFENIGHIAPIPQWTRLPEGRCGGNCFSGPRRMYTAAFGNTLLVGWTAVSDQIDDDDGGVLKNYGNVATFIWNNEEEKFNLHHNQSYEGVCESIHGITANDDGSVVGILCDGSQSGHTNNPPWLQDDVIDLLATQLKDGCTDRTDRTCYVTANGLLFDDSDKARPLFLLEYRDREISGDPDSKVYINHAVSNNGRFGHEEISLNSSATKYFVSIKIGANGHDASVNFELTRPSEQSEDFSFSSNFLGGCNGEDRFTGRPWGHVYANRLVYNESLDQWANVCTLDQCEDPLQFPRTGGYGSGSSSGTGQCMGIRFEPYVKNQTTGSYSSSQGRYLLDYHNTWSDHAAWSWNNEGAQASSFLSLGEKGWLVLASGPGASYFNWEDDNGTLLSNTVDPECIRPYRE